MKLFLKKRSFDNYTLNWHFIHKKIWKLQNQIVKQLKKKNIRNVRNFQRLLLKSLSAQLLISQKFIELQSNNTFVKYKQNNPSFHFSDLINFIQLENIFSLNSNSENSVKLRYFHFLSLLWVLALIPINETYSNSFSYNCRLYRDQTDILNEFNRIFNYSDYKWLLIIKPSNFFNHLNKKWIIQNTLIEKKFLVATLKSRKFAKYTQIDYNHKEILEIKKISLVKLIKSTCFYNLFEVGEKLYQTSILYYSGLILIPSTSLNTLKESYIRTFHHLKFRGLFIRKNRIWVINMREGFTFLGWFIKKESNKIIIQISNRNIKSHQFEIKQFLKSVRFWPIDKVIIQLNKKIINWQLYYAYSSNLFQTWSEMNYYVFWRVWRWCKKRHKNKGSKWIYNRYWAQKGTKKWIFHYNKQCLKPYFIRKQVIMALPASINVCEIKNLKKFQRIISQKYLNFKSF